MRSKIEQNLQSYNEREQKQYLLNHYTQKVKVSGAFDRSKFVELLNQIMDTLPTEAEKDKLVEKVKSKKDLEAILQDFVDISYPYMEGAIPKPSLVSEKEHVFRILGNETNIENFVKNPIGFFERYRDSLPIVEQQVFEKLINHPDFKKIFPIGVRESKKIITPLTAVMAGLELPGYGSNDAITFETCINPEKKEEVLHKARREVTEVPAGTGASPSYSKKGIEATANNVKAHNRGECHTFAQLALDQLMKEIEKGTLPLHTDIKMVSFPNKLGSHTFLIANHNNESLDDLSNCLIIDPWAAVMGYDSSNGIFIKEDYPYPDMTRNLQLICKYDSATGVLVSEQVKLKSVERRAEKPIVKEESELERAMRERLARTESLTDRISESESTTESTTRSASAASERTSAAAVSSRRPLPTPGPVPLPTTPASSSSAGAARPLPPRSQVSPSVSSTAGTSPRRPLPTISAVSESSPSRAARTPASLSHTAASSTTVRRMFSSPKEIPPKVEKFLLQLEGFAKILKDPIKEKCVTQILQDIRDKKLAPGEGMNLAASAVLAETIDETRNGFSWSGVLETEMLQHIILAFYDDKTKSLTPYWSTYVLENEIVGENKAELFLNMIDHLNAEEHSYEETPAPSMGI